MTCSPLYKRQNPSLIYRTSLRPWYSSQATTLALEFILWVQKQWLNWGYQHQNINGPHIPWNSDLISGKLIIFHTCAIKRGRSLREGRTSCEMGYVWWERMTAQKQRRCYMLWPKPKCFVSLCSSKSFKGSVQMHNNIFSPSHISGVIIQIVLVLFTQV